MNSVPARPRVLFVDDEPRVLVALKAAVRGSYEVTTAVGGEAAVELLRTQDFDVVVSDQRMPGMAGVEVLRRARELRPRAVRILLTGYSDLNATIGAINEGEVFRFVAKPWSNLGLRDTLAAAVKASSVTDQPAAPPGPEQDWPDEGLPDVAVLILDPDAQTRETVRNALAGSRPVYCAAALEEGMRLLARHPIGVIVTELDIEGEDLTAALGALRQHAPSLVSIVLTGYADAARAASLINHSQIYRLLRKPVSDQLLRGTVNLASRRYLTLETHPELVQRHEVEAPVEPAARAQSNSMFARIKRLLLG
jgi:DNA-binding NtrC family response regulator